jgi:hypothetical protein
MSESREARCPIDLSVVVPLYNEEESVQPLYERITEAVAPMGRALRDPVRQRRQPRRTLEIAAGLASRDPHLKVIDFRGNYGQTPAMAAGIDHARGTLHRHHGRRPAERSGRYPGHAGRTDGSLRHGRGLAQEPPGQADHPQGPVLDREPADRQGHRRADQGQRLLAEDLSRQRHQAGAAVLGDAPLHPGDGLDRGRAREGGPGAPPRAPVRPVQVRPVAGLQGAARPAGHQDHHRPSRSVRWCGSACWRCRSRY